MIIVLIHWKIKSEMVKEFLEFWRKEAIIEDRRGLAGEFLCQVGTQDELSYITWDMDIDGDFNNFINVGIWPDEKEFANQVACYFNDEKPMLPFEYARRVRTVLKPKCWRIGDGLLPYRDSDGVL